MEITLLDNWPKHKAIAGYTNAFAGHWHYNEPADRGHYEALAAEFGLGIDKIVRVHQQHTDEVLTATLANGGEGVTHAGSGAKDGLLTNVRWLMLCVVTADCTPVFLYDPVHEAIGMVHSGRAGTMQEIALKAVQQMHKAYGTQPESVQCILGPYISQKHHEVEAKDVQGFFANFTPEECAQILLHKEPKYYVDMGVAIRISLGRIGVKQENIKDLGVCTYDNKELYSWRRDHDKNARILSFIFLPEQE